MLTSYSGEQWSEVSHLQTVDPLSKSYPGTTCGNRIANLSNGVENQPLRDLIKCVFYFYFL